MICVFGILYLFEGIVAGAQADILARGKTDSGIKLLVFPLSMKVIQNRPLKGSYYFHDADTERFDEGLGGEPAPEEDAFDKILSDRKTLKKTLVNTDPSRVAPSVQGEDHRGPLDRAVLKNLAKEHPEKILFIFRRDIRLLSAKDIPPSAFLNPKRFLNPHYAGAGSPPLTIQIRNLGILYLTKQNKIISLPPNEKETILFQEGPASKHEEARDRLQEAVREGLKELAASAKKALLDHKFEKRRSNY